MAHCRYRWLQSQGLSEQETEPCGICGPCTRFGIEEAATAETVAEEVRSAIKADDRSQAKRLIRRAVHAGIEEVDLFLAGGESSSKAKSRSRSASTTGGEPPDAA